MGRVNIKKVNFFTNIGVLESLSMDLIVLPMNHFFMNGFCLKF